MQELNDNQTYSQKINPHSVDEVVAYFNSDKDELFREVTDDDVRSFISNNEDAFFVKAFKGDTAYQAKVFFPNDISVWCYEQVRSYNEFITKLKESLSDYDICLKDGHPYNSMFNGYKAGFVDLGSLQKGSKWSSFNREARKYKLIQYLYRVVTGYRIRLKLTDRKDIQISHIAILFFLDLLSIDQMVSYLEKAKRIIFPKKFLRKSKWSHYVQDIESFDGGEKAQLLESVLDEHGIETMIDLGCNTGYYSVLAAKKGVKVLAMDLDETVLSRVFLYTKEKKLSVTSVVADMEIYEKVLERTPECLRPKTVDLFLGYAILHHLVHFRGYDFFTFFNKMRNFSPKVAIIEFISYEDRHASEFPNKKHWYNQKVFCEVASQYGYRVTVMPAHDSGRSILVLKGQE